MGDGVAGSVWWHRVVMMVVLLLSVLWLVGLLRVMVEVVGWWR